MLFSLEGLFRIERERSILITEVLSKLANWANPTNLTERVDTDFHYHFVNTWKGPLLAFLNIHSEDPTLQEDDWLKLH